MAKGNEVDFKFHIHQCVLWFLFGLMIGKLLWSS